ncbi:MAG: glycosyl hydrolase family 57 [Gemmataceae bacterium]
MNFQQIPELVNGLPNICGNETQVAEATRPDRPPVFLHETNLQLDRLRAVFAIALHMQQPLIPAGGDDIRSADLISNLDHMMRNPGIGDNHNASVFAECYARMGDIIPEQVDQGRNPRVMLDYSGELLYGLRKMGRGDVIDRLKRITCDHHYRKYAEWLGTMWGHAVVSSTPLPDLKLHMRAWQQNFAAVFGWDALSRVKGFSPPEMHLPNHPDAAYEYVRALKECGYKWLLVQEHTVEPADDKGLRNKHVPHRLLARNSEGEELSILALIKTQGSDTKLVAQMQPFYEAKGLQRVEVSGISIPPIVTQIGDGENGGVMMNEFPPCFRQAVAQFHSDEVVNVNGTEYLELIEQAGVKPLMLPAVRPIHQGQIFERIQKWEPGAADKAIAEIKKDNPHFSMDGGSWTNNISWVQGYENVLDPMNQLSAQFHRVLSGRSVDTNDPVYRNALFHLLTAETSCFRYWGQGVWTDYAREICRRGSDILAHDFH